ncbi:MAG: hypothetical protein AAFX81_14220 [Pseudomonadota bacterium]
MPGVDGRVRSGALTAGETKALWWALPPLLVFAMANLLFDIVGAGYGEFGRALAVRPVTDPGSEARAAITVAGLSWAATAILHVAATVGCSIAAWRIVRSRVVARALRPFRLLTLCLVVLGVTHLALVDALGLPMLAVFEVTFRALALAEVLSPIELHGINVVLAVINITSGIVPALFLTAAAASALPPVGGWDEAALARRARQLRELVAIAAVYMVAGVVHMGAWTHWAVALVGDPTHAPSLAALAQGVTLFWGTAFTAMIASFYVPMTVVLRRLAGEVMDATAVATDIRPAWLKARGLSFDVADQLPQVVAMAAPLLAGPLSAVVGVAKL